jgi:hypothetical protein
VLTIDKIYIAYKKHITHACSLISSIFSFGLFVLFVPVIIGRSLNRSSDSISIISNSKKSRKAAV